MTGRNPNTVVLVSEENRAVLIAQAPKERDASVSQEIGRDINIATRRNAA